MRSVTSDDFLVGGVYFEGLRGTISVQPKISFVASLCHDVVQVRGCIRSHAPHGMALNEPRPVSTRSRWPPVAVPLCLSYFIGADGGMVPWSKTVGIFL